MSLSRSLLFNVDDHDDDDDDDELVRFAALFGEYIVHTSSLITIFESSIRINYIQQTQTDLFQFFLLFDKIQNHNAKRMC